MAQNLKKHEAEHVDAEQPEAQASVSIVIPRLKRGKRIPSCSNEHPQSSPLSQHNCSSVFTMPCIAFEVTLDNYYLWHFDAGICTPKKSKFKTLS